MILHFHKFEIKKSLLTASFWQELQCQINQPPNWANYLIKTFNKKHMIYPKLWYQSLCRTPEAPNKTEALLI